MFFFYFLFNPFNPLCVNIVLGLILVRGILLDFVEIPSDFLLGIDSHIPITINLQSIKWKKENLSLSTDDKIDKSRRLTQNQNKNLH